MKIIQPYVYLDEDELAPGKLRALERAARLCYKSEAAITADSAPDFLRRLLSRGHESVIEHEKATVYFVTDRGVTHEIVRHRVGSYSQESTRYCNYGGGKFGGEITVIEPFFLEPGSGRYALWHESCLAAERAYLALLADGTPQEARDVLPNSLKTEIAVTYNFREWRHFFRLRCAPQAHPQMQQVAIPLLLRFREALPCLFEDIPYNTDFPAERFAAVRAAARPGERREAEA